MRLNTAQARFCAPDNASSEQNQAWNSIGYPDTMKKGATNAGLAPVTTLRGWLDHLAARDRLQVIRPGIALRFELAAVAKHFEGRAATLFPKPGGHEIGVVSGIVAARGWIAGAMGVEPAGLLPRFEAAA